MTTGGRSPRPPARPLRKASPASRPQRRVTGKRGTLFPFRPHLCHRRAGHSNKGKRHGAAGGSGRRVTAAPGSNPTGILLMALAMLFFALADTIAKVMTAGYHPMQVVGIRQLGLFTGVAVYLVLRGPSTLRTRRPGLQFLRGACATVSATLFVAALSFIPLTDAAAIAFAAPFFVTILGFLLLGEPVGLRRWAAIVVGFAGTLVIIRPGFE